MYVRPLAEAGMAEEEDGKLDPKQAATLGPDPVVGEIPWSVEGVQATALVHGLGLASLTFRPGFCDVRTAVGTRVAVKTDEPEKKKYHTTQLRLMTSS